MKHLQPIHLKPLNSRPIMKIAQRHGGGFVKEADKQGSLLKKSLRH